MKRFFCSIALTSLLLAHHPNVQAGPKLDGYSYRTLHELCTTATKLFNIFHENEPGYLHEPEAVCEKLIKSLKDSTTSDELLEKIIAILGKTEEVHREYYYDETLINQAEIAASYYNQAQESRESQEPRGFWKPLDLDFDQLLDEISEKPKNFAIVNAPQTERASDPQRIITGNNAFSIIKRLGRSPAVEAFIDTEPHLKKQESLNQLANLVCSKITFPCTPRELLEELNNFLSSATAAGEIIDEQTFTNLLAEITP